ncbi:hypothetical protein OJ996_09115 [Luteolibacter sp. GHJ8]|uniref:DUF1320 domain-containing protein n=1 Tax=Luteolibacter rhizosphaerae TaxID=2989719 RepID=A0ABT3G1L7_9BACT|nr:hypothetical protein [Luteolibacter rhizosphaerae]MCW1913733.1 hypothetical protein [Luteolibacter rhizosphaerae]
MSWVALQESDVLDRLADDERASYEEAGESGTPTPRLPGIINQVTATIREAIESNPQNYVGDAGKIPPGAILHAATLARLLLIGSQPTNEGETNPRQREESAAWDYIKRIQDRKLTFTDTPAPPRDASTGAYGGRCYMEF